MAKKDKKKVAKDKELKHSGKKKGKQKPSKTTEAEALREAARAKAAVAAAKALRKAAKEQAAASKEDAQVAAGDQSQSVLSAPTPGERWKAISIKMPASGIAAIDAAAKSRGVSRSEYIRLALEAFMA